jgi:serine protease Do
MNLSLTGFSLMVATVLAATPSVVGAVHSVAQAPATSVSATLFRDIARRENPVVVSVMTRSRVGALTADEETFRFLELVPPEVGRVHRAAGSGFVISSTGDILTSNHLVEGAERIEVSLFGNERKRYRAIRVGSDPLTDCALIRLQNPPATLQAATLGDSSVLEPGDWVLAIGNPFQLEHSVTAGIVSFPQRPLLVQDDRWQDMIQTDLSINVGQSGGPLFNIRGEVVGINIAMLEANSGTNVGIGFAVPINTVKASLAQLRNGRVVRGQLGVQLHGGPILEDEATELRLPTAAGAIVRIVNGSSAAERAGVRAGDVIVAIDGKPIAHTRDLIARTAAMAPGTRVTVKTLRFGEEQTRTVTIEEQPLNAVEQTPADDSDGDDGLTLDEITPRTAKHPAGRSAMTGALVVGVDPDSPADDAELVVGDIVRAINGRPVHTLDQAKHELRQIEPGRPIFLLVSRRGTEVFLEMRRNY